MKLLFIIVFLAFLGIWNPTASYGNVLYDLPTLFKEIKNLEGKEVSVIAYFRDSYPEENKFMVREGKKYILEVRYEEEGKNDPIIRFLNGLPPYSKVKLLLRGVIRGKVEPPFKIYWIELISIKVLDLGEDS